jgi:hypothetical protein
MAAILGGMALFLAAILVWTVGFQLLYAGRIFPGVSIAGLDLSGLTPDEAALRLSRDLSYPHTGKIVLRDGGRVWLVTPAQMGMTFDASASAQAAYKLGRSGGPFTSLDRQLRARSRGVEVPPVILFDQRVAYQYLQSLSAEVDQPVVEATLKVEGAIVVAVPGQLGRLLDVEGTLTFLSAQMQTFRDGEVPLVIREQAPESVDVSAQADVARRVLSEPLRLFIPNAAAGDPGPWTYEVQSLANMLTVQRVGNEVQVGLAQEALREVLLGIATQVDRPAQNARFYFDDATHQLVLIQNATIGRAVDTEANITAINTASAAGRTQHRPADRRGPAGCDRQRYRRAVGDYRTGRLRNILFLWLQHGTQAEYPGGFLSIPWPADRSRRNVLDGQRAWRCQPG